MTKKIQKNERGVAHALLAVLVIAVIAVVGLVAWKVNDNRPTLTTGINKDTQDKCMTAVNDKQFCKFAGVFANIGDYKVTVNSTDKDGVSNLELANASNGNSSIVIKANGQERGNIVVYSGVTYYKDYTDGKWFKFGPNDANKPQTVDLKKEFLKADFKGDDGQKLTYKNLGTEKCGNLNCFKYQTTDPKKPDETDFLWFDTKDYLLRRVTVSDSKAKTSAEMIVTYGSVVITLPSPTKDVPAAAAQ